MNNVALAIVLLRQYIDDDEPRTLHLFGCSICSICGREVEIGQHEDWCTVANIAKAIALLEKESAE